MSLFGKAIGQDEIDRGQALADRTRSEVSVRLPDGFEEKKLKLPAGAVIHHADRLQYVALKPGRVGE